jgi:peptidoglycan/LPS O-acetylase OafA/YrhL
MGNRPSISTLILNLTGLFGFFGGAIATGAWSIGNELAFYCFFPIFIFRITLKRHFVKSIFCIILIVSIFCVYVFFAYCILQNRDTLESQWHIYINPLNQVFLFLGGILIGYIFLNISLPKYYTLVILLSSILVFAYLPAKGNGIVLVTGHNRIVFTFICFLVTIFFYKQDFKLPVFLEKAMSRLGECSYSVYLLHPIVFNICNRLLCKILIINNLPPPSFNVYKRFCVPNRDFIAVLDSTCLLRKSVY